MGFMQARNQEFALGGGGGCFWYRKKYQTILTQILMDFWSD